MAKPPEFKVGDPVTIRVNSNERDGTVTEIEDGGKIVIGVPPRKKGGTPSNYRRAPLLVTHKKGA